MCGHLFQGAGCGRHADQRRTGRSSTSAASATSASKQWSLAEADLRKALELFPDQPQVLNYLGYSWVDQGIKLDDGMTMIRRAVEQRPDDGYIVDSLGWAYFRTGNMDEAVKNLERAVELRPGGPDHQRSPGRCLLADRPGT